MRLLLVVLCAIVMFGCGKKSDTQEPSTAQQAIEGFTGKKSVDRYLDTKKTITDIQAKQKERYEKVP